jgi:hypothetical protein
MEIDSRDVTEPIRSPLIIPDSHNMSAIDHIVLSCLGIELGLCLMRVFEVNDRQCFYNGCLIHWQSLSHWGMMVRRARFVSTITGTSERVESGH